MNRKSPRSALGLLALLAALSPREPEPRRRSGEPDFRFGPTNQDDELLEALFGKDVRSPSMGPTMDDSLTILAHEFEELPNKARKVWDKLMASLNNLDINEIDTAFVVVLKKSDQKEGEPCKGCGEVHAPGLQVIGSHVTSNSALLEPLIRIALRECRDTEFPTGEKDFLERR